MFSMNVWTTRHYMSDHGGQPTANSKSLVQRQWRTDDQVSWVGNAAQVIGCNVRYLSLWRRHLVNAYEVKAGIGVVAGKTVWSMPKEPAWHSRNALDWARLIPGWVTVFRRVNHPGTEPGTQVDSAWAIPPWVGKSEYCECCGSGHC